MMRQMRSMLRNCVGEEGKANVLSLSSDDALVHILWPECTKWTVPSGGVVA